MVSNVYNILATGSHTGTFTLIDVHQDAVISSITPSGALVGYSGKTLPAGLTIKVDFTAITVDSGQLGTYSQV